MASELRAEDLMATATDRAALDDFGEATFRVGLDRLLDGLAHEAQLNEVGEAMAP